MSKKSSYKTGGSNKVATEVHFPGKETFTSKKQIYKNVLDLGNLI